MNFETDCKEMVENLFDKMDDWRQHPKYQLERRVDLYFYLYLKEVLEEKEKKEKKAKLPIQDIIIPEFPVRKGTIFKKFENHKHKNMSCNIDYVAISEDKKNVYYIELKTDRNSINEKQNNYLKKTMDTDFGSILEGIKQISKASKAKLKYYYLLEKLESLGLISNLKDLHELISDKKKDERFPINKFDDLIDKIIVNSNIEAKHLFIIQPSGEGDKIITFDEFRETVSKYNDCISKRFAKSLESWSGKETDSSTK